MMDPATPAQRRSERDTSADSGWPAGIEAVVADLLRDAGMTAVLRHLNARTRYRFTGIYHVEPPVLRNVALFDRENPTVDCAGAVSPLDETYCSITARGSAPFATADASRDPRLCQHAARESVLCYSGVPIRLASGATWGTLCHFDLRPRLMSATEIAVLQAVMPVIAEWISTRETRLAAP